MRTSNRAQKTRAQKSKSGKPAGGGTPGLRSDLGPAHRAVEKIKKDAYVSAERRRQPITV